VGAKCKDRRSEVVGAKCKYRRSEVVGAKCKYRRSEVVGAKCKYRKLEEVGAKCTDRKLEEVGAMCRESRLKFRKCRKSTTCDASLRHAAPSRACFLARLQGWVAMGEAEGALRGGSLRATTRETARTSSCCKLGKPEPPPPRP